MHTLLHSGQATHICISKLTIIGSDNGLSPGRCQAIIWTNAGILLMGPFAFRNKLQWNLNRNMRIFNQENAFENVVSQLAAIWSWPQCVNASSSIWSTDTAYTANIGMYDQGTVSLDSFQVEIKNLNLLIYTIHPRLLKEFYHKHIYFPFARIQYV